MGGRYSSKRQVSGDHRAARITAAVVATPAPKPMARAARVVIGYFVSTLVSVASFAAEPLEEPSQ